MLEEVSTRDCRRGVIINARVIYFPQKRGGLVMAYVLLLDRSVDGCRREKRMAEA